MPAGRIWLRAVAVAALLWHGVASDVAADPTETAVFDFELIDTSLEGATTGLRPEEQQRLARISDQLRDALAGSGRYAVLDLTPVRDRIRAAGNLYGCNGCAIKIARSLGAEVAITGRVQKVSNLILSINIEIWDVASGTLQRGMSADIRGNTDESWSRGLSYLLRNRLLTAAAENSGAGGD